MKLLLGCAYLGVAAALIVLVGCAVPVTEKKLDIDPEQFRIERKNYRLTPGDIVSLTVFQEDDMATEQRIAQDGTVNISLIGRVAIGGLTVEGAGQAIEARLKQGILVNPQVTVSITTYAPRRFTIFGQVAASGSYEIPSEEIVTLPTAVAMAGGHTRIGNIRSVAVTRRRTDGIFEYKVNLLTPEGRQFIVEDGDLITVPESLF